MKNTLLTLFEISVYASAIILAVFAIKSMVQRKLSAKLVHILWLVVLVRLLLPVTFNSPVKVNIPIPAIITAPAAKPSSENVPIEVTSVNIPASVPEDSISSLGSDIIAENYEMPTALPNVDYWLIAVLVWLIGALAFIAVSGIRIMAFKRKISELHTANSDFAPMLEKTKQEIHTNKDIIIALSSHTDIPFVYGIVKPVIVMPKKFIGSMTENQLSYIILHELCHVKRHDVLINFVWLLARALHWFNPLAHLAYKNYLDSADRACDEMVSRNLHYDEKCEYSQSLIDVIRYAKRNHAPAPVLSLCRNKSTLARRIENIIHPKKKSKIALFTMILALCVVVFACFTTACKAKETADEDARDSQANIMDEPSPTLSPESVEGLVIIYSHSELYKPTKKNTTSYDTVITVDEAINNINPSLPKDFYLENTEDYFGDNILRYSSKDRPYSYAVLESDHSLVYYSSSEVDCFSRINLSQQEYDKILSDYIKDIWNIDEIEISEHDVIKQRRCTEVFNSNGVSETVPAYLYSISGTMGQNNRPFSAHFNGEGELIDIASFPIDVDFNKGISKNEALNLSGKYLDQWRNDYPEITAYTFTLTGGEIFYSAVTSPSYAFTYQYRSENPSVDDYDFDYRILVSTANGDLLDFMMIPIIGNIEVISMDEAKKLALQYASKRLGDVDASMINLNTENFHVYNGDLTYSFEVQYTPEYPTLDNPISYYLLKISAATGELLAFHVTS